MGSVTQLRQQLHAAATAVDANGNGVLAHQEIAHSDLPKEARKVLAQATSRAANSEGGQRVDNVQRWVDTFVADFERFDADGSGALSPDELAKADPFRQRSQLRALQRLVESDWLAGADPAPGVVRPGMSFWELREQVTIDSERRITDAGVVDATLEQQLIAACHQSTYTHVQSLDDAFAAVDGGEFVIRELTDPANGKRYVAIDYGAGDSTYGALFEAGNSTVAFGIEDGELVEA